MGLIERPKPLSPCEQIALWRREGYTLKQLATKIRTPELRAEIERQLQQQAIEARAPKVPTSPIVTGG